MDEHEKMGNSEGSPSATPYMRDRLFRSFVDDLRKVLFEHAGGGLSDEGLIGRVEEILGNLKTFSSEGEVQNVLSRAEMVILDGVCRDVGMKFANSSRTRIESN